MIRTYKRKLIINKEQEKRINSWIGACRCVYNMSLEIQISAKKAGFPYVNKYELMRQLTTIKDIAWISDVPSQSLQNAVERLDRSYKSFFGGGGFPKFAAKRKYKSILIKSIKITNGIVTVPKIGSVKYFKDSEIIGIPKTATIKKEPTGYFICIVCDNVPKKFDSENQTIGLDMGLSHFCVDSNGGFISNPKHFKKYERQLRIENRSLARKKKGSNSWKKQAKRLSLLHHKIGNVRRDFLHKESTRIAKSNSIVCLEDLNIVGMARNGNLSKHILDAGWGLFRTMLEYKTAVVRVNPKHTSQACSKCGHVDSVSRLSQSNFTCTNCGHSENADVNAAKNILRKGIALGRQREPTGCALTLNL